jgi:hypothetical protein
MLPDLLEVRQGIFLAAHDSRHPMYGGFRPFIKHPFSREGNGMERTGLEPPFLTVYTGISCPQT